jgi:hypothetical protein
MTMILAVGEVMRVPLPHLRLANLVLARLAKMMTLVVGVVRLHLLRLLLILLRLGIRVLLLMICLEMFGVESGSGVEDSMVSGRGRW